MPTLHVERSIQFRRDLYGTHSSHRLQWFRALGEELASRKLSVQVGPNITVSNPDEAAALYKRYLEDPTGLSREVGLPATTTLTNYFADLVEALDDCVKTTSTVKDQMVDFTPASALGKLLGLDSSATYASGRTEFGKLAADAAVKVGAINVSKRAGDVDPLAGQVFMSKETFANSPRFTWDRDGVELEHVSGVKGVDGKALSAALRARNGAGRTNFERLRRPEIMEAFAVGYSGVGLDELRWDADAHRIREASGQVALTVESGRYDLDPESGARQLSVATDKMDDTYYDTADFTLTDADIGVRGRARWASDTEIRRILIGVKSGSSIDEFGVKRTTKVDTRNDSATAEDIKGLDEAVRSGRTKWSRGEQVVGPLRGVYEELEKAGKLQNVGPHEGVLQLEPKMMLRSIRSRYHMNETSLNAIQDFYGQTSGKLQSVLSLSAQRKGELSGGDLRTVTRLETAGLRLQSGETVARLAEAQLKALDPNMVVNADTVKALMPSTAVVWNAPVNDTLSIEKKRVVSEAVDRAFHDFAEELDGARRVLAGAQDRTLDAYPDLFVAWAKSVEPSLRSKNAYEPFLARYDQLLEKPPAERASDLAAFNAFGEAQRAANVRAFRDFRPLDDAGLTALRPLLLNEVLHVNQRQLEAAGTAATQLYFDEARQFYVPGSRRNTSNFIIDTIDVTDYYTPEAWSSIPEAQRTPANELPADKAIHTTLVNEAQIELGLEQPYVQRLAELSGQIYGDRASLVMKFLDSSGAAGIDRSKPETYAAAAKNVGVRALNVYLQQQGSALQPLSAADLARIDPALFTLEARDRAVRTDPSVEKLFAGARTVFTAYIDAQKLLTASKEERVERVLGQAGLRDVEWSGMERSKGQMAMDLVRGGQR